MCEIVVIPFVTAIILILNRSIRMDDCFVDENYNLAISLSIQKWKPNIEIRGTF